ncbi:MAG: type VI secretion system tip protein TssI/VgrG [Planctomycetota bacterium]
MICFTSPLGDNLEIVSFKGREAISELFEFELGLISEDPAIDARTILGHGVTVALRCKDGSERAFHGHVAGFEFRGTGDRFSIYHARVVPWAWFLQKSHDCRIFQKDTVVDIVRKVFGELPFARFDLAGLQQAYREREYCVQYRESDFAFVSRLLEEEGIFYFFRHEDGAHTMVFADHAEAYERCIEPTASKPAPEGRPDTADDLRKWVHGYDLQTGVSAHADYNFKLGEGVRNLSADSTSILDVPEIKNLELYDYPGLFLDAGAGDSLARIRQEAHDAAYETVRASGFCRSWTAGGWFELTEHNSAAESNKSYLVVEVEHEAQQPGQFVAGGETPDQLYINHAVCIPKEVVYRPPATRTPRPRIHGAQTAEVVGPPGEEIHTDTYARIKVKFHWDRASGRDQDSSCFIRVAQMTAGKGWGTVALPRIGHEVLVHFLEGDPDQPLVMGSVYNEVNPPPTSNAGRPPEDGPPPTDSVQAAMMTTLRSNSLGGSGGHNEITMNDAGGAEGLFIKAQHNEIHNVGNDRTDTVGNDETNSVGNDRTDTVGNDEKRTIGNNRTEDVGVDEEVSIGSNRSHKVGSNDSLSVGSNLTVDVGSNASESVGSNKTVTVGLMAAESIGAAKALNIGAAYSVNVGAAMNTIVGGLQSEQVGFTKKVDVGSSIEFTCGSSKLTMDKSGKITIKGTEISIDASGPVKINGSVIDLN